MVSASLQRGIEFIRRQHRSLKVNLAKNVVQNFSLWLTKQYQSIYIIGLGADPLQLGYVNSIGGAAVALISFPLGWLADRHGIRKILIAALPLMALGSAIFALSWRWEVTALALIVSTMALRMAMTVCPMICGSTLSSEERATGMQLCDTLSAAPRLVAPIVAAYLITAFGGMNVEGIRVLYWIQLFGLIAAFLIIYALFTNPRERVEDAELPRFLGGIDRVLKEGRMVKRWTAYLMLSSFPMYLAIYVPLFAAEFKGADQYTLGWMETAAMVTVLVLALPSGRLADIFGRKKLVFAMTPLYCASLLLLVYAPSAVYLLVVGLLRGFLHLASVTGSAVTADLVPQELLGSWYGMIGFFRGVVSMVSPLIGGLIWTVLGPHYVFYFLLATQVSKLLILASVPSSLTRG